MFSPGEEDDDDSQDAHAIETTQEEEAPSPAKEIDRPKLKNLNLIAEDCLPSPVTPVLPTQIASRRSSTPLKKRALKRTLELVPTKSLDSNHNENEFTQMSPTAVKSMCDIVDSNVIGKDAVSSTKRQRTNDGELKSPHKQGLFRKLGQSKRFSYPTKKQIDESCPSKIFHLEKAPPVSKFPGEFTLPCLILILLSYPSI